MSTALMHLTSLRLKIDLLSILSVFLLFSPNIISMDGFEWHDHDQEPVIGSIVSRLAAAESFVP